ncbi:helix-turn-helix domain-containing protein [Yoonia sp. BS5-3]|uniref:ArsR/SmtB family transcription factor n=1 Tax=Yoonia phaeophyticola TaxID=3137369 RepID=A0ABZ2V522_9RHOB
MELESFGQAVSHRSRVAILIALFGGKALPASELAYRARISGQTASSHLSILTELNVIKVRKCGRHRYFELASEDIAEAIEALATKLDLSIREPKPVEDRLRTGRFCYNHLAGRLGTSITDVLVRGGVLAMNDESFQLLDTEHVLFRALEIDPHVISRKRGRFAPRCLDWSERRPHVAGILGSSIAQGMLSKSFIERTRDDRSVTVTNLGKKFLVSELGLDSEPSELLVGVE